MRWISWNKQALYGLPMAAAIHALGCGATGDGGAAAQGGAGGANVGGSAGTSSGGAGSSTGGDSTGGDSTGGDAGIRISVLGTPCPGDGDCAPGSTRVTYCGFAGCDQGSFCSCEIRCDQGDEACPDGTSCATVSDGPGEVCVRKGCSAAEDCGRAICCGSCTEGSCSGLCHEGPVCPDGQMPVP